MTSFLHCFEVFLSLSDFLTLGFLIMYSSASLLCSRKKTTCRAVRPGCTFERMSPATNSSLPGRWTGFSLASRSLFFYGKFRIFHY